MQVIADKTTVQAPPLAPIPTPFVESAETNRKAGIGLGSTLAQCTQSWGQVLKVREAENGPNGVGAREKTILAIETTPNTC
jgi:hypothetical protein